MLFYQNGPYPVGRNICPRYSVDPLDVDSCTVQTYSGGVTCRQFCSSFPGMTCLNGAGDEIAIMYNNYD